VLSPPQLNQNGAALPAPPGVKEQGKVAAALRAFRRMLRDPLFCLGVVIMLVLLAMVLFAPWIAPFDPARTNFRLSLRPPSLSNLMGTDPLGRDIFSRVVHGARLSLLLSFAAVGISLTVGVALGLIAGFFRGLVGGFVMRCMDVLLAFPGLTLVLVFAAVFGAGMGNVIIAVGIAGVPTFTRVTAGSVMSTAQEDYVQAAVSFGAKPGWIIFRHILPNIAGPILILATLYLAFAIQAAAALSFLGIGVRPPTAEWGAMVNDGRRVFMNGWWVSLFPGLMIMLFVLAANLIGDVLRDELDATQRARDVNV
jgi:peptide/nickel transport system permease protein